MRLFIAILLEEEARKALVKQQTRMRATGMRGRWTPEENLHLTMAFIGEYPRANTALEVVEALEFSPFEMCLEGMGAFGRLWWTGVNRNAALEALSHRLRANLAEAGLPFDRKRFQPHITLLRDATFARPEAAVPPLPAVRSRVERLALMRSERGKNGVVYTEIEH